MLPIKPEFDGCTKTRMHYKHYVAHGRVQTIRRRKKERMQQKHVANKFQRHVYVQNNAEPRAAFGGRTYTIQFDLSESQTERGKLESILNGTLIYLNCDKYQLCPVESKTRTQFKL